MKASFLFFCLSVFVSLELRAQFGPDNGVKATEPNYILLQNATLMIKPGETAQTTDLLIKDGKIIKVAKQIKQDGAVVLDYTGKYIVPSFVELYSDVGLEPVK
ncbi:MAG: amidohydrolase, partial [Crocinitomicaceae bacterium]